MKNSFMKGALLTAALCGVGELIDQDDQFGRSLGLNTAHAEPDSPASEFENDPSLLADQSTAVCVPIDKKNPEGDFVTFIFRSKIRSEDEGAQKNSPLGPVQKDLTASIVHAFRLTAAGRSAAEIGDYESSGWGARMTEKLDALARLVSTKIATPVTIDWGIQKVDPHCHGERPLPQPFA